MHHIRLAVGGELLGRPFAPDAPERLGTRRTCHRYQCAAQSNNHLMSRQLIESPLRPELVLLLEYAIESELRFNRVLQQQDEFWS